MHSPEGAGQPGGDAGSWRMGLRHVPWPRRGGLGVGVVFCLLLLLPPLFARSLWAPDEMRYAEVARAMGASGRYWTMRLNQERYAEKPPLFFWLSAAVSALRGGHTDQATRWVSAVASLLTAALTAHFASRLFGAEAGVVSLAVLVTSLYFAFLAQLGNLDSLLTLFTTAAVICFWKVEGGGGARPRRWLVVAYLLVGLAVLTKGPVGFLVPALALLALRLHFHGWRRLPPWHLLWGLGIVIIMTAVWLVPASALEGWGFFWRMLVTQNLGRTVNAWRHAEPLTYYLVNFPLDTLPWIVWLPGAFVAAWRCEGSQRSAARSLLSWFVAAFLMFSLLSGKRARYLLPLYPAVAILIGAYLAGAMRGERTPPAGRQGRLSRLADGAALAVATLLSLGSPLLLVLILLAPGVVERFPQSPLAPFLEQLGESAVLLAALWGTAAAAALFYGWRSLRASARQGVVMSVLATTSLAILFVPWIAYQNGIPPQPLPELRRELQAGREAGPVWLYEHHFDGLVNLALQQAPLPVIPNLAALRQALDEAEAGGAAFRLIARARTFERFPEEVRARLLQATQVGSGRDGLSILLPRPPQSDRRQR